VKNKKVPPNISVDKIIKEFTYEANKKLDKQYEGTKQAIVQISKEKVQNLMKIYDMGLCKEDREAIVNTISKSMMQSFSLGYGLGKAEGIIDRDIYL
jgi:hypothetical protein